MNWNPNVNMPVVSPLVDTNCTICLEKIVSENEALCEGEKPRILDCSHIFHRECIGSWLVQKHNCPLCRAPVTVDTPEAPSPEMMLHEILAVPDSQLQSVLQSNDESFLFLIRQNVLQMRRVRQINLNENTPLAVEARKVASFATRFFNNFQ